MMSFKVDKPASILGLHATTKMVYFFLVLTPLTSKIAEAPINFF